MIKSIQNGRKIMNKSLFQLFFAKFTLNFCTSSSFNAELIL